MKTNAAHIIDFGTLASSQALYANSAKCEIDDVGTKCWRLNGKLHRTDGPAVEYANGTKYWLLNDEYHRTDGPAVEWADGSKEWHLNGKLHRADGPACEYANGHKYWYINGIDYSEEEFNMIKEVLWAI